MQNPLPPPSSAQESALPGAPAPLLVPRHLKVSKPSHSHLKAENDSKCSPQTQASPGEPRCRKKESAQRSHGDGGCRAVPVLVLRAAGWRQGRMTEADVSRTREEREAVFTASTLATLAFAWSKIPQSLVSLRRPQVGSGQPGPQDEKHQFAGAAPVQGG